MVGIALRKPPVDEPRPGAYRELLRSPSATTARILGMKVETLGNVGAYLSNMASGGPTVNTINYGTGTYKIENYEARLEGRRHQYRAGRCLSRLWPARGRLHRRARRSTRSRAISISTRSRCGGRISFSAPIFRIALTAAGVIYDSGNYQGCLDKAVDSFRLRRHGASEREHLARPAAVIAASASPPIPICAAWRRRAGSPLSGFDRGGWESARVAIDSSGRATIYSGSMSQGHGHVDVAGADRRRRPADSDREHRRRARRHEAGAGRPRHVQFPLDGGRRIRASTSVPARIVAKAKKIAAEHDGGGRAGRLL